MYHGPILSGISPLFSTSGPSPKIFNEVKKQDTPYKRTFAFSSFWDYQDLCFFFFFLQIERFPPGGTENNSQK